MATHSKKEFAELCGTTTRHLSIYIKRKKVVVSDVGLIDDTVPQNNLFLKKRAAKPKQKVDKAPDPAKIARDVELKELLAMEKEAKQLAILSKRKEQTLLDARIQKMHGVLIPTDLVKNLFAQHFREVSTSFKQGIDGILSEIGKKAKLNGNQMAEIRGRMVKILNESVERSVNNSKKSVQNVVTEYQTTKNPS
jgi:hypothetical protein